MNTLVLKTVDAVSNPDIFKRIGYSNFKYTANLSAIDPTKPPILGFGFFAGSGETRVEIDGATIYKIVGSTPDFTTPYNGVVTLSAAETGDRGIAFVPTKSTGFVRIKNGLASKIEKIGSFFTNNDSVLPYLDLDEFQAPATSINNVAITTPSGYSKSYVISGDINSLSRNASFYNFYGNADLFPVQKLSNTVWNEKIKSANVRVVELNTSRLTLSIDVSIFPAAMILGITIVSSKGITLYGDISTVLAAPYTLIMRDNLSQAGITGSINSLSTARASLDLNAPNLTGGYTSRAYTGVITRWRVLSDKVTAADYDLVLSDLATRAANMAAGAAIQVSRRTSASDASVATLVGKGCTVVVSPI